MLLQPGPIRLAMLDASGAKLKTLMLPIPDKGGLDLEWDEKGTNWELENGDELFRPLGYLPVLTCKWSGYDQRPGGRFPLGTDDGQRPALEDLLAILSRGPGLLRVSPGLMAGGFTVNRTIVKPIGRQGVVYTGLQVVFRARFARSIRDLEVF